MLDVIKRQWQQYKFQRSTEGQALRLHTQDCFSKTILRSWSKKAKEEHIQHFSQNVSAIVNSPNPFLSFREHLGGNVFGYAELQVLCLKPEEKSGVHASRYISGELYPHIRQCKDHVEWIGRLLWEEPNITEEELIAALNARCALMLYHANGLNILRGRFEQRSLNDPKDWFLPFVRSMLISAENTHRQKLHLPSLLGEGVDGSMRAFQHSSFFNLVVDGVEQPLFAWERHHNLVHTEAT